jgi:hypothetical protein
LIGLVCLSLYGYFKVQAYVRQAELEQMLELSKPDVTTSIPKRRLKEGDLFGRLEIPRLNMSVMVMVRDH